MTWRDHLKVHPAADLFPMMSDEELADLGKDIRERGLMQRVIFCGDELLDGRNRLEAIERKGLTTAVDGTALDWASIKDGSGAAELAPGIDPYDYVISANIHRRHLTEDQRRELIAKIIKAKPEASDRTIAKQVKRDHKAVARVRKKLESTGAVAPVERRVGADGKARALPPPAPAKPRAPDLDDLPDNRLALRMIDAGYQAMAADAESEEAKKRLRATRDWLRRDFSRAF